MNGVTREKLNAYLDKIDEAVQAIDEYPQYRDKRLQMDHVQILTHAYLGHCIRYAADKGDE